MSSGCDPLPYKLLSLLLQYPDDALLQRSEELSAAAGALSGGRWRAALLEFLRHLAETPPGRLQAEYVATFDLQRRSCLYLTFYAEGDTRKRGQALLRLKRLYASAGLELEGPELPDYLPVMLEFAALAPAGLGERVLADHRLGLEVLRTHLEEISSPYHRLVQALCQSLPRSARLDPRAIRRLLREGPPREEVGLQPFGPPELVTEMGARR